MKNNNQSTLRSVLACNLGIAFEGFDFIVYSFFSVFIAKEFFPSANDLMTTLTAFATFGVAYLFRPLGGIFWGVYADKQGRRLALAWISILMAIGVAIIAFTPSYASIGIAAPILIVLARFIQGFCQGGEFASATSMLVEYALPNRRGLYASTQMATQVLTIGLISILLLILNSALTPEVMASKGWRWVFVVGILIGPIGLYMRSKMAESPEFERLRTEGRREKTPIREVFRNYRRESLIIAGMTVIGSASFYLIMVFLPTYAGRTLKIPMFDTQISTIICCVLSFAACLYSGWLSDRYSRLSILLPATIAYAVLSYPLFLYLIGNPGFYSMLIVQGITSIILGFISGPFPAAMSELFPAEIRSSGLGMIYNIVGAIFGGLGPFLITLFIGLTGDKASPAYWALLTGVIGAISIICLRYVSNGPLRNSIRKDMVANEPTE